MSLVERDAPMRSLQAAAERAAAGHGGTVLLSGEAGIGKTALLEVFAHSMHPSWRLMWGACDAAFTPRPLGPLYDIGLKQRNCLRQLMDGGAPITALFSAFLDLLGQGITPSLVVIEDLQWADRATLDLVRCVGRRIARLPALLVLSYRDDELGPQHPLPQVLGDLQGPSTTRLALGPLSPRAVEALALEAGQPADGLHAACDGNPFLVSEMLWCGSQPSGLPAAVTHAVRGRLARLDGSLCDLLDSLAVEPQPIAIDLLETLHGPQAAALIDACLARRLLVADEQRTVAFRQPVLRRAVYEALPPLRRRRLHLQMLQALQTNPGVSPERLLHHAAEAGEREPVLALALPAADHAAGRGAHAEAARHCAAALHVLQGGGTPAPAVHAELLGAWAEHAVRAHQVDPGVIAALHRALALWRAAGRPDRVGRCLRALSRVHRLRGERAEADRCADEAVRVLQALPPDHEFAMACSARAQHHQAQGHVDEAVAWAERALALATTLDDLEVRVHALNSLGTTLLFADRAGGAERLEQSLSLALAGGLHAHAMRAYAGAVEHAVLFRHFRRAETLLSEGLAFGARHAQAVDAASLEGWLAQLRFDQGRLDEAWRIADRLCRHPQLAPMLRLPAMTVRARIALRRGEPGGARLLAETLAMAQTSGEPRRIVPVVCAAAEAAWLRGDAAACRDALRLAEGLPSVAANPWQAGEMAVWRRRSGEPVPAPVHTAPPFGAELCGELLPAAAAWSDIGAPYDEALVLMQLQGGSAADALASAASIFDDLGARPAAERTRLRARELGLLQHLPRPRRGPYAHARAHRHGLTAREAEVLHLIVLGHANAEIAQRLSRSERTVEHHVSALLAKLNVKSRAEAAALAQREGLLPAP